MNSDDADFLQNFKDLLSAMGTVEVIEIDREDHEPIGSDAEKKAALIQLRLQEALRKQFRQPALATAKSLGNLVIWSVFTGLAEFRSSKEATPD